VARMWLVVLAGGLSVRGDQPWRPGGRRAASLTWVLGAWRHPGDKMIDCCDVRSHVVSECVEGGWLMPGT
jgi:hypothetical protein